MAVKLKWFLSELSTLIIIGDVNRVIPIWYINPGNSVPICVYKSKAVRALLFKWSGVPAPPSTYGALQKGIGALVSSGRSATAVIQESTVVGSSEARLTTVMSDS